MEVTAPLLTPLVMKGDRAFVAHENPYCTEKVTGRPIIRPSSLKGQFRHALLAVCQNDKDQVDFLCGYENEETESGKKGRLEFFPCYVDKEISYDVLAPHDETLRRIDPGPVSIEVIEPPCDLSLWIQYWPLDLLSTWSCRKSINPEDLIFDLISAAAGVYYWFYSIGIGAKTSSGYGQVDWNAARVSLFTAASSPWANLLEGQPVCLRDIVAKESQKKLLQRFTEKWNGFQQSR
jgi:CRISPR/Cas system CMR subunit Cmr6 (Cas7 group RAMP superfamily)